MHFVSSLLGASVAFGAALIWLACSQVVFHWTSAPVLHMVSWVLFVVGCGLGAFFLQGGPRHG